RAQSLAARLEGVQFFARLKANGFARSDADLRAGAGIAADSGFARADAEDAESSQFNALAGRQGLLEALEDCIDGRLGLGTRQTGTLDHLMNDVLFDQWSLLAGANWDATSLILQILRRLANSYRIARGILQQNAGERVFAERLA